MPDRKLGWRSARRLFESLVARCVGFHHRKLDNDTSFVFSCFATSRISGASAKKHSARIGSVLTLALTFAGQMLAALLFLDHYGALGLTKYSASPTRIAGVVIVFFGVFLIAYAKW